MRGESIAGSGLSAASLPRDRSIGLAGESADELAICSPVEPTRALSTGRNTAAGAGRWFRTTCCCGSAAPTPNADSRETELSTVNR